MIKLYLYNNWKKIILLLVIGGLLFILYRNSKEKQTGPSGDGVKVCTDNYLTQVSKSNTYYFEVMGQVINPGVYEMDKKMLVIEAIEYAGGFSDKADLVFVHKYLSLSSEIKPTQKVYIPAVDEAYTLATSTTANPTVNSGLIKINLNSADSKTLMTITGVGEVTANKIIELRPLQSLEDLKKLVGVPQKTITNIIEKAEL
jgi:competence protein ComEA